jgi:hypothetical protein
MSPEESQSGKSAANLSNLSMRSKKQLPQGSVARAQPAENCHIPTSSTWISYSGSSRTTAHRYLLNHKLAVTAHIKWAQGESESDTTAFFRTIARRLIGVH